MTVTRALRFARLGGPEVLSLDDVELPEPGPGQVRVDVHAAGLNPYDAKVRTGVMGGAPDAPKPVGAELAGVVTAVGPGATVAVGDRVLGMAAAGTAAMATAAIAGPVARMPDGMDFAEAAAWPVAGETALRALGELGVTAGDTLLVHGGAGTVGRMAIQLAVRRGAGVIATCAPRDIADLESLGRPEAPVAAVPYGDGWADRVHGAVQHGDVLAAIDAVLDAAGTGVLAESVALAGDADRVITIAGNDAEAAGVRFTGGASAEAKATAIAALPGLWDDGVRVPVAKTFPLDRAQDAYAALDARDPRGKLVITT